MIEIKRISENIFGEADYQLLLNGEKVGDFKHNRQDGLKQCLIDASNAVDSGAWAKTAELYKKYGG